MSTILVFTETQNDNVISDLIYVVLGHMSFNSCAVISNVNCICVNIIIENNSRLIHFGFYCQTKFLVYQLWLHR